MRSPIATALTLLAAAATAPGIIRPDFTPRHLVNQCDLILVGRAGGTADANEWRFTVERSRKGKAAGEQIISLRTCKADQAEEARGLVAAGGSEPAVLFADTAGKEFHIHVAGMWLAARSAGAGKWEVTRFEMRMTGTYAGGTDMLIRMVEHLIADPRAGVPISAGVSWLGKVRVGRAAGGSAGLAAVEVGSPGRLHLFVASAKGDRLFRASGNEDKLAFEDVTAGCGLAGKSAQFAWADVNADGVADLVSAEGRRVSVFLGRPDGKFTPAGGPWRHELREDAGAIAPCPNTGSPGVLVSTRSAPVHLAAGKDGWQAAALPRGQAMGAGAADGNSGSCPTPCVVADLDGDGYVDVLQPARQGGWLWRGGADGFRGGATLRAAATCSVAIAEPPALAAVADFDASGSLDVFLIDPAAASLWSNDGKGSFTEVLGRSGSLSYHCPPGAADAAALDLNGDGWADLCLIYPSGALMYHFNRTFRCFGEEGEVRLEEAEAAGQLSELPAPDQPPPGLRSMASADFNGDGAADLAVLRADGTVWCYLSEPRGTPTLRLRLDKGLPGPVTVLWSADARPGAPVTAVTVGGSPLPTLVALPHPGPVTVRYRLPGKAEQTLRVVVTRGVRDVSIIRQRKDSHDGEARASVPADSPGLPHQRGGGGRGGGV